MFIILGGTGHVGSAVAQTLLEAGQPVTIVTRNARHAAPWRDRGAQLAEADVTDRDALRDVLRTGRRAFLLNPPADPSTDTDKVERGTVADILAALDGSGLEFVVAQSTIGARPGGPQGDLNVLYGLEQGLAAQPIPATVVRAGYHFANWDADIEAAGKSGFIESPLPLDRPLGMVAPADVGRLCAMLLQGEAKADLIAAEGPRRYTAREIIAAVSQHVRKPVEARQVPEADLEAWFSGHGFSQPAAESYAAMTRTLWSDAPALDEVPVTRGPTTFEAYLAGL